MNIPIWVEVVNKLATPTIAAVSAFYVYLQYKRAQRWKAADLAASLLDRLEADPALSLACHALDWGVGPLLIPEQYQPLFPREASGEYPGVMQHDVNVLVQAIKPQLNQSTLSDPKGLVYRFCYIKLFNHLDNIYTLLKDKQLRKEDLAGLKYWLALLHNYHYAPQSTERTQVFLPALKAWGYANITRLAEELNNGDNRKRPKDNPSCSGA
ncbi:MAG TPA: hypothetical protein VFZ34_27225 [Blastocatellia bacterium]|nr:hypothetical protein [Blastocatellia bacterium]